MTTKLSGRRPCPCSIFVRFALLFSVTQGQGQLNTPEIAVSVPYNDSLQDRDSSLSGDDSPIVLLQDKQRIYSIYNKEVIDFRDLFLSPAESIAVAGSGLQPYGDIFSTYFWPNVEGLTRPDPYGNTTEPGQHVVNTNLIEPLTLNQSGVPGNLEYPDAINAVLLSGRVNITFSDFRINNLNSVLPLQLIQPTTKPHTLTSSFIVGKEDEQEVVVAFRLGIAIEGQKPLVSYNEVDISFTLPSSTFHVDIVVLVDKLKLFRMPLAHILYVGCWMDTLVYTDSDAEYDMKEAIHLQRFQATLAAMSLNVTCVSCVPTVESFLPRLMNSLVKGIGNTAISKTTRTGTINKNNIVLENSSNPVLTQSVESFVEDAVWNLWKALDVDNAIREAAKFCPSHPDFLPEYAQVVLALKNFTAALNLESARPTLSKESFETVIAGGLIGGSLMLVGTSQQYLGMRKEEAQKQNPNVVALQSDTAYVNWTSVEFLDTVRKALTPETINNAIQNSGFLNALQSGALALPVLKNLTFDSGLGFMVTVDQVNVMGLDTLTNLNILDPVSPFDLETVIELERLFVRANLTIAEILEDGTTHHPETISVSMELRDIGLQTSFHLRINLDLLGELQLGTILQNVKDAVPCFLAASRGSYVEHLQVKVGTIGSPFIHGYLSPGLQATVNSVSSTLFSDFQDDLIAALPIIFQTTIRESVNEYFWDDYVTNGADSTVCLANTTFVRNNEFVDFYELFVGSEYGKIFKSAYEYLQENVFSSEGVSNVNKLIGGFTQARSGVEGSLVLLEEGVFMNSPFSVGNLEVEARVRMWNITLTNLNSIGLPFTLIYPSEANTLHNNVSVGVDSRPMTAGANILFSATDGANMDIYNNFFVQLSLEEISVFVQVLLKMSEKALFSFPLKFLSNPYCWFDLLPPARPSELISGFNNKSGIALNGSWGYDRAHLEVDCENYSCTSPQLPELLIKLYREGEADYDSIEELFGRFLESDGVKKYLNDLVADARQKCPHSPDYNPNTTYIGPFARKSLPETLEVETNRDPISLFMIIGFISFSVVVLLSYLLMRLVLWQKNRAWKQSLTNEGSSLLRQVKEKERERDECLDKSMFPLFYSKFVPRYAQTLVPIALVLNIVLFAVAHSATSIIVGMDVYLAGDDFHINNMFEFNFKDGLRATYENGGYEMAILLVIFAGIWPYFKCLLTLGLWFAPPSYLRSSYRGELLLWIDAMNKLTVRDIFKFLVVIALLFVYFGGPEAFSRDNGDLYSISITGVPGPAIYCGISAMILSRVSSRWILDFHQNALEKAQEVYYQKQVELSIDKKYTNDRGRSDALQEQPKSAITSREAYAKSIDLSAVSLDYSNSSRSALSGAIDFSEMEYDQGWDQSGVQMDITTRGRRFVSICGKRIQYGAFGFYIGILTLILVALLGLIFIPAVNIDLSSIAKLFLESGTTYDDAISAFGVYSFICVILFQARLLLGSTLDYIAVGCILLAVIIAMHLTGCMGMVNYVRNIRKSGWRQIYPLFFERQKKVVQLPAYLRLYAYRDFGVFFLAYSIGIFQLGAVTIYAIHYFCSLLDKIYESLEFVGLIPNTGGQCWEAQLSHSHNLVVFFGCFIYLTVFFMEQLTVQYKHNVRAASQLVRLQAQEAEFMGKVAGAWRERSKKKIGSKIVSGLRGSSDRDSKVTGVSTKGLSVLTEESSRKSDENESSTMLTLGMSSTGLIPWEPFAGMSEMIVRSHRSRAARSTMSGLTLGTSSDDDDSSLDGKSLDSSTSHHHVHECHSITQQEEDVHQMSDFSDEDETDEDQLSNTFDDGGLISKSLRTFFVQSQRTAELKKKDSLKEDMLYDHPAAAVSLSLDKAPPDRSSLRRRSSQRVMHITMDVRGSSCSSRRGSVRLVNASGTSDSWKRGSDASAQTIESWKRGSGASARTGDFYKRGSGAKPSLQSGSNIEITDEIEV